jgi:hypothetical protein
LLVEIGFGCISKAGAALFTVDLISVFEIVRDRVILMVVTLR